ncbi:MAG: DUF5723 family protein [Bacteroidia bacterium]
MKKIALLSTVLGCFSASLLAQNPFTYNNRHLSQSHLENPAFLPQYRFTLGLTRLDQAVTLSGITLSSLFDANETPLETATRIIKDKDKQMGFDVTQQTDLFHLGYRSAQSYVALNSSLVTEGAIRIPKDLMGLAFLGNAAFIEDDCELDFSGTQFRSYLQNTLSYGRFISHNLSVGASFSLLNGFANVNLEDANIIIDTDTGVASIYQMEIQSSLKGQASLFGIDIENYLNDSNADLNQMIQDNFSNALKHNKGYKVNLGAVYRLNEKIRISGSIGNLGSMTWDWGAQEISLPTSTWKWTGLDTNQIEDIQNLQIMDTLMSVFDIQSSKAESYTTAFKPRYTLGLEYFLLPRTYVQLVGGYGYGVTGDKSFVSTSFHQELGEFVDLRVNYTYYDFNTPVQRLGLGTSLNLGPLQIWASVNDILGVIDIGKASTASGAVGLNINIGTWKDRDNDMVPDKRDSCYRTFGSVTNNGCPLGFLGESMNYEEEEAVEIEESAVEIKDETEEVESATTVEENTETVVRTKVPTEATEIKTMQPKPDVNEVLSDSTELEAKEDAIEIAETTNKIKPVVPVSENKTLRTKSVSNSDRTKSIIERMTEIMKN